MLPVDLRDETIRGLTCFQPTYTFLLTLYIRFVTLRELMRPSTQHYIAMYAKKVDRHITPCRSIRIPNSSIVIVILKSAEKETAKDDA